MTVATSLPELPEGWAWEAVVGMNTVKVQLRNTNVTIAERTGECPNDRWESNIYRLAAALWDDVHAAAKLSAKLGITVLYE